jgi:glycosyltransferase involved in cell wall biosynthesis
MGEGPLMVEIAEYVNSKKLNHHIFFNGFEKNILPLLNELDLFLITSTTEGLGTSILDAFACKIPVVATNAGGIPELIQNQKTGLLSPIKNAINLAENIEQVLMNNKLKNELIENAFLSLNNFSKSTTAEKTLTIYTNI